MITPTCVVWRSREPHTAGGVRASRLRFDRPPGKAKFHPFRLSGQHAHVALMEAHLQENANGRTLWPEQAPVTGMHMER
ncbi:MULTISPECIES: hypothetical protein [Burkholderia cepacia complex]|uniref:hypothetical protein n=1 Tax=Burkholderia cepacia complex TaxID=87882 RepID=UPI0013DD9A80|nr:MULTISPECIES: hypothetical protein [Burkholderia cepacia complex]